MSVIKTGRREGHQHTVDFGSFVVGTPAEDQVLTFKDGQITWADSAAGGTWETITGDQSTVNLSGFNNDAGFLTAVDWGDLGGTLADQTDLQVELDRRADHENGYTDRADSTISFDNATRTFTIAPTGTDYEFYSDLNKYISTGDSVVIANTEGLHYIYYDTSGTLVETTTFNPQIITRWAFTAAIYWDATNNEAILFEDERHGNTMDSATHIYNHVTFGTRYETGLGLTNLT